MDRISPQVDIAFKKIFGLEVMNFGPEERQLYEDHLKWMMIEASTLKKAEEKGIEQGIEKKLSGCKKK